MQVIKPLKPILFVTHGLPGAGKTFFARQLAEESDIIHIHVDRIRYELFDSPQYTKNEELVVMSMSDYQLEQLMQTGRSVILDGALNNRFQVKTYRELAKKFGYEIFFIFVQTDADTAYQRATDRDRRHADDKYSPNLDNDVFDLRSRYVKSVQGHDYVVVSGKHVFKNQYHVVRRKLEGLGYLQQRAPQVTPIVQPRQPHQRT